MAIGLVCRAVAKTQDQLTPSDLVKFLPPPIGVSVRSALDQEPDLDQELDSREINDANMDYVWQFLQGHLLTLVRFHRTGAVVFSESPLANLCKEHLFPSYPESLFAELDPAWKNFVRKVVGPGLGATVPPLSAVVLSRLSKRSEVAVVIRELREEYQASRTAVWDRLESMWTSDTLSEQMKILWDLEAASSSLFPAAFPQRCRFLETALSATVDLADAKLGSAAKTVGVALLQRDEKDPA
jgi:hypothetical protein